MRKMLGKVTIFLLVFSTIFCFAGCGKKTDAERIMGEWYEEDSNGQLDDDSIYFEEPTDEEKTSGEMVLYDDGEIESTGSYTVHEETQILELSLDQERLWGKIPFEYEISEDDKELVLIYNNDYSYFIRVDE